MRACQPEAGQQGQKWSQSLHSPYFQILEDARVSFKRGTLYVAATPLGNLADITLRTLALFDAADIILAEDTRVTGQLLARYGLRRHIVSVREHNERSMADKVIGWLQDGKLVAQVSDAGTPAVSDPGARLCRAVWEAGLPVSPLPGASAVTAALSASGVMAEGWRFAGFLSPKSKARREALAGWLHCSDAVVIYEAPHRIQDTVADIVTELGEDRPLVLARELTKTFETILRLPAAGLLQRINSDPNQSRGEMAIIIEPAPATEAPAETAIVEGQHILKVLLAEGLPVKQAASITTRLAGGHKKAWYEQALALRNS